jgi:aryl-alcohol dehydrogenase-like predicted oxidoreductase
VEYRPLGTTGLRISAVGLGTARLALPEGKREPADPQNNRAAVAILEAARALGCTHFDTADIYGYGASESLLGEFLAGLSQEQPHCVVTTKVGGNFYKSLPWDVRDRSFGEEKPNSCEDQRTFFPRTPSPDFSPAYLEYAVGRSLARLRRESVDLLLLHDPTVGYLRSPGWQGVLQKLRAAGKCSFYGVSVRHPFEAYAALEYGAPDVLQVPTSMVISSAMRAALKLAKRKGVGIIGRELFVHGQLLRYLALLNLRPSPLHFPPLCPMLARTVIEEVLSDGLVDGVVVGCSNVDQVCEDFGGGGASKPDQETRRAIRARARTFFNGRPAAVPRLDEISPSNSGHRLLPDATGTDGADR